MKVDLECPHAEYRDGMKVYCRKVENWCGNAYFKTCKGWWALTPRAAQCPLRKENKDGNS